MWGFLLRWFAAFLPLRMASNEQWVTPEVDRALGLAKGRKGMVFEDAPHRSRRSRMGVQAPFPTGKGKEKSHAQVHELHHQGGYSESNGHAGHAFDWKSKACRSFLL